jgi:hypothetical protein
LFFKVTTDFTDFHGFKWCRVINAIVKLDWERSVIGEENDGG